MAKNIENTPTTTWMEPMSACMSSASDTASVLHAVRSRGCSGRGGIKAPKRFQREGEVDKWRRRALRIIAENIKQQPFAAPALERLQCPGCRIHQPQMTD